MNRAVPSIAIVEKDVPRRRGDEPLMFLNFTEDVTRSPQARG